MAENCLVSEVCFYTPRSGRFGYSREHSCFRGVIKAFTGVPKPSHMGCSFNEVKVNNADTRFKDDLAEALVREVTLSSKTV